MTSKNTLPAKKSVYIWGTPIVDWLSGVDRASPSAEVFLGRRSQAGQIHLTAQAGGSALLKNLLQMMAPTERVEITSNLDGYFPIHNPQEASASTGTARPNPLTDPFDCYPTRNWTHWQQYERVGEKDVVGQSEKAFRLSGWSASEVGTFWHNEADEKDGKNWYSSFPQRNFDLLIIDDRGLRPIGRDAEKLPDYHNAAEKWKEFLRTAAPQKILIRLAPQQRILCTAPLKAVQSTDLHQKATLLLTIEELRAYAVQIGVSLSWERLFDDVIAATKQWLSEATQSAHCDWERVIVMVGLSGAVVYERSGNHTLVFDRFAQENIFERQYPGYVLGYSACMEAALTTAWVTHDSDALWCRATRIGLCLMRALHRDGYTLGPDPYHAGDISVGHLRPVLRFPHEMLADLYHWYPSPINYEDKNLNQAKGQRMGLEKTIGCFDRPCKLPIGDEGWTMLRSTLEKEGQESEQLEGDTAARVRLEAICGRVRQREAIYAKAREIVEKGLQLSLEDIPVESVEQWSSADRREIEGVRSVHNAIRTYLALCQEPSASVVKGPLSIAVFGPPGAGKSFVVKQIAAALGISDKAQITFNLSQYADAADLARAFHRVRDLNLASGTPPVVFWDEFDTPAGDQPLGWLRHFLVPMQDGEFNEHGVNHPVGRGIYVFAGGTSASYQAFLQAGAGTEAERGAKKPDFISRLSAYIDVKGPNGEPDTIQDGLYMIRRAVLLRSYLEMYGADMVGSDGEIQLEDGVLNAFLRTVRYRHGARSMEALVRLSPFAGKTKYELSSLPPAHLLAMHVDAQNFMDLARSPQQGRVRIGVCLVSGGSPPAEGSKQTIGSWDMLEDNLNQVRTQASGCFQGSSGTQIASNQPCGLTIVVRLGIPEDFALLEKMQDLLVHPPGGNVQSVRLVCVLPLPAPALAQRLSDDDGHLYDRTELPQALEYWMRIASEIIERPPKPTWQKALMDAQAFIADGVDITLWLPLGLTHAS